MTDNSNNSRRKNSRVKRLALSLAKIILVCIVIYFVGRRVVQDWHEVVGYSWSLQPGILALSVTLHLATFLLFSKVWCILMKGFGHNIPLLYAFKIGYMANLGRYVPGKIWPVLGMAYLAQKINIPKEVSVASWGIALVFALASSFMAALGGFLLYPDLAPVEIKGVLGSGIYVAGIGITVISIILVLAPNTFLRFYNLLLRMFRKPEIRFRLNTKTALQVYLGYFVCWICYGMSFWVFLHAVFLSPPIPLSSGIASFIIAYQIGYLAFFSPGGIGVREWVLTIMLTPYLGPAAVGISVAARVWNLATEIIAAVIAWRIRFSNDNVRSIR